MILSKGIQQNDYVSHSSRLAGRAGRAVLAAALLAAALSWADEARANEEVRDWNQVLADMEPQNVFFMQSRLAALLHVSIHDALNSIPGAARYETYLPPVPAPCGASPRAALAAAGRTLLLNYISFYSNPSLPPLFYNPGLQNFIPEVESVYHAQLAAIPSGPAKAEGIHVGEQAANNLWNLRLDDGWNNPDGLVFEFPNNDGDNNPMTGLPGEYVMLDPADTIPGTTQPYFFWWGYVTPWIMTSNDQFLPPPPPSPTKKSFLKDLEETRLYGEDQSAVRTPAQSFTATWWEGCGLVFAGTYAFTQQLVQDNDLDNYEAARVFALTLMTQADAMIANVNSKNFYNSWRPITAIDYYYPGSDWHPFLTTSPNQEYPAGHPMISSAAINVLIKFFGSGQLDTPLEGATPCGTLGFASLPDAIDSVIDARVWAGVHFRHSGEVGAKTGKEMARYAYKNFLTPL